ncbi:SpoIIE family protein phosphatase [Bacteroidota bacterium]
MRLTHILEKIPIFQGLYPDALEKIIPLLEEETYPSNTMIIREGAMGDSMYVIHSGSVKVTKKAADDEEVLINTLETGAFFGELSLIDNQPRSASVISREDTLILRLRKSAFNNLLEDDPVLASHFYKSFLAETFTRFRHLTSDFTFSKHDLDAKSSTLEEINKDLTSARKLQDFFINPRILDSELYPIPGIKQSYIYNPCQEVGGDFLNLVPFSTHQFGVVIADVMGHGITAALATGSFKSAFSIYVKQFGTRPGLLLKALNDHFYEEISFLFASCLYAYIDVRTKRIRMARAGHYYPFLYKTGDDDFADLTFKGTALGMMNDTDFEEINLLIEPGDKALFFTDGIIEQKNESDDMYSLDRLKSSFKKGIQEGNQDLLTMINVDLFKFAGLTNIEDDTTLFLLEFLD